MIRRLLIVSGAAALSSVLVALAIAQTPPPPPVFKPGLGELMTAFVQPRHIKLGLGGQARNWEYAAYERQELEETFEDVGRYVPMLEKYPIAEMVKLTEEPLKALKDAVQARDGARFDVAYNQLTDACNACHVGTDHPMIVIRFPASTSPFADQNFSPRKP